MNSEDVLKALAGVRFGTTALPESGRLSPVVVDPSGRVTVSIGIDPAEAAAAEPVRAAAEAAIRLVPGVSAALVSLTAERAPGSAPARPAPPPAGGMPRPPRAQSIPGVKHIFAVASGKGGVGKSTTAVNLALALKARGLSVGLLDADIYGPSAPKLFGLGGQKPRVISGRILEPLDGYGVQVMSIGFLVEEETAMIWRGPMVMSAITQMLREVAWSELDALVVDMPPGTGDAQLTMAQAVPLAGAVIVSTPQDLALIDARRGVAMFRKVEVPILGIVENMASFACPACGHVSHIFGHGGARAEAEKLGVPFLGEVPLEMAIRETSDSGRPVVAVAPEGPHAASYRAIADRVWERITGGAVSRPAPRIVIE
ncbi:Mrp/NBP35 family ATP-binding protein [Enterovirga rhinocerotis]|uniref:Iron-sulfur cluster carrier protein n=1 Tax=Enterovirga rhinocerotis TaxID=1339210 RepID=A0A4R7C8Z5_9HYPH|nr:Mrp/NBP35 family ATP-binding protein [Enterovirga rhinocerotis]TDR93177.1 ATP-binding protein involved in chromosome partitioning [Enterovirga rhinocerotis]